MTLLRLALLYAASFANQITYTAPNQASSADEIHSSLLSGPVWRLVAYRSSGWALTIVETLVFVMKVYGSPSSISGTIQSYICPTGPSAEFGSVNIVFLTGVTLFILGGWLRLTCYRTLGRLYTFEHTTRPKHNLVTTGPYAFVRHPGYTAIAPSSIASVLTFLSAGGWIRECGVWEGRGIWTVVRWSFGMWVAGAALITIGLLRRAGREDKTLQKNFGKEWEDYRKRVPWKFIPYIV